MNFKLAVAVIFVLGLAAVDGARAEGVRLDGRFDPTLVAARRHRDRDRNQDQEDEEQSTDQEPDQDLDQGDEGRDTTRARAGDKLKGLFSREERPERKRRADVGWFMGLSVLTMQLDMSIFDPMTQDRKVESFSERGMLSGPMGGIIYRDLRVGALMLSGYQHHSELVQNKRRNAFISFTGFAGFMEYNHMIERRYPRRVPYLRVGYLVGVLGGSGDLTLSVSGQDVPKKRWEASQSIPFADAYAGVWLSPFDWLWFQLDLGYIMPFWDTADPKFKNAAGKKMVDGQMASGLAFGFKIIVGKNPNIYYEPPPEPGS
ncbi:MAG TPA: hypothetical protein VM658_18330 [bacterium]|nr:hypothetical protein [bacterium]